MHVDPKAEGQRTRVETEIKKLPVDVFSVERPDRGRLGWEFQER